MGLARRSLEILTEDGIREFTHRAFRFYRRKFPGPLTPLYPHLVCYDNERTSRLADRVYTTQDPQSAPIEYTGELTDRVPPFVDEGDWMTENLGRNVYQFPDADVIGSSGGVLNQNRYRPHQEGPPSTIRVGDRFVVPAAIGTKSRRKELSFDHIDRYLGTTRLIRHRSGRARPDREFEHAFLVTTPYGQAYGAFQSDLFKLRAFERYKQMTGTDPQLIVPPGPSALVREYLSLMGYPPESYVTLGDETVRVDRLLVPSQRPRKGNGELQPSPSDRRWARDRILSNLSLQDGPSASRIYVSRQNERRRRVVNIDEIRPILDQYGLVEYNPGDHPLRDQIRTFAQADLFVGPHSSGMLNSMFASDASVIELLSEKFWRTSTVFVVANEMGFDYEICPCEPISDSHDVTRHQDIRVEKKLLEEQIERALRTPESAQPV